jgi:DNA-3-methyladenine glycosylase II
MVRVRRELITAAEALSAGDPAMRRIIDATGPPDIRRGRPKRTHFAELARAVCYQQLAGAAARTIHGRFEALFKDHTPTPEATLRLPVAKLRGAGLSGAKAASIRDLAERVVSGDVELDRAGRLSNDELLAELTRVRGIGRWTAEMFLIFQLGRLDVWPVDDLGVRKGYAQLYRLRTLPLPKQLETLGDTFRPYRSVAAWYCWRAADTVVPD